MSAQDPSVPPAPGPIRPFEFPPVGFQETSSGLALRTAHLPRFPLISTVLVVNAAESSLPGEQAGLAVLAGQCLEGGTTGLSAAALAEAFESIGSTLGVSAGWNATTLSVTCLAERLPRALALLAEVVRTPAFPESEVDRVRGQQLARLRQRAMDPSSLADDWAARLVYAEGSPYGRPLAGTQASVSAHGREAVRAFADTYYRPGGGGLILAGDLDPARTVSLVEYHFGGWTGQPPAWPDVLPAPRSTSRSIHVVHRPGAVQSELRLGHPGVPRGHEDYFPLVVANASLGGAFTSRLNMSLRERHGFTYGVRSRFSFRRGAGPFSVSTSVGTDVTAPAVQETLHELEKFAREGPNEEETLRARDYLAGIFPLSLETTAQVASMVAEVVIFGLPADHHARYRERIRAVTTETAHAAVARHVRPHELTVVVVGDANKVVDPLEALGVGPVEVHGAA